MKEEIATNLPARNRLRTSIKEEGTYVWSLELSGQRQSEKSRMKTDAKGKSIGYFQRKALIWLEWWIHKKNG